MDSGPKSIVDSDKAMSPEDTEEGKTFGERIVERKAQEEIEEDEAVISEKGEEVDREEASKIGTDEQEIPDAPEGLVTVSQGTQEDKEPEDAKMVKVFLPKGKNPVFSFKGDWGASDVNILIGAVRKAFRLYQNKVRRGG